MRGSAQGTCGARWAAGRGREVRSRHLHGTKVGQVCITKRPSAFMIHSCIDDCVVPCHDRWNNEHSLLE